MGRPGPGAQRNDVEAAGMLAKARPLLEEGLGRPGDALALARLEGLERGLVLPPPLDLDEDDDLALPDDEVDLADRGAEPPGENAVTLQAEIEGGDAFGAAAAALAAHPIGGKARHPRPDHADLRARARR